MRDKQRDVLAPPPERRHLDVNHVEAVVQVLAELTAGHQLMQIAVRGGDDAHVDLHRFLAPDRTDVIFLQNAQQLDLKPHGHVADFIQQQRSALRGLKQALL